MELEYSKRIFSSNFSAKRLQSPILTANQKRRITRTCVPYRESRGGTAIHILIIGDDFREEVARLGALAARRGVTFETVRDFTAGIQRVNSLPVATTKVICALTCRTVEGEDIGPLGVNVWLACKKRAIPTQLVHQQSRHSPEELKIMNSLAARGVKSIDSEDKSLPGGWNLEKALTALIGPIPPRKPVIAA